MDAGSDMITTNSYGIIPGVGFSKNDIERYAALSGKIALNSTTKTNRRSSSPFIVCGSLGPLVESYRPDLIMDHSSGVEYYKIMANSLSPYVDVYLAETMSSVEEASQYENGMLRSGEDDITSLRTITCTNRIYYKSINEINENKLTKDLFNRNFIFYLFVIN